MYKTYTHINMHTYIYMYIYILREYERCTTYIRMYKTYIDIYIMISVYLNRF